MSDVAIGSYEQHVAILETVDVSKVAFDEIGRVVLASVPDCCCVCERSIIICRGECCEEVLS